MNLATTRKVGAFEDALLKSPASNNGHMAQQPTAPIVQIERGNIVSLNPELLISKAIDAKVPIEALERLLSMRAELKREQAREAFNNALAEFQASIPPIKKSKTANVQSKTGSSYVYHYADIADIQRAIALKMRDCRLSVTFDTLQNGDILNVICVVHHSDGHSEKTTFPVPIDRQARMNDTQKVGSALTYGRRYALCAALGIVTAEDDDDGQASGHHQPAPTPPTPAPRPAAPTTPTPKQENLINEKQHRLLELKISKSGLDRERIKKWLRASTKGKVEHFNDLNQKQFNGLLEKIDEEKRKLEEEEKMRMANDQREHGGYDADDEYIENNCPF